MCPFLSDIYIKLVFIVYLEFLGTDYQQEQFNET